MTSPSPQRPARPTTTDPEDEAPAVARATWRDAPGLMLRGGFVGMAEGVPGISGGTIALVVGLFDRLIDSAGQLVHALRVTVSAALRRSEGREVRAAFGVIDWRFLAPVLLGMAVVLVATLSLLAPLLEAHPVQVSSVFLGMIAVSILVPLRMMPHRPSPRDLLLIAGGAVVAFGLTSLPRVDVAQPPLWLVFVGAAIAINALVVPGVSGSFVLLTLGLYIPVQAALADRDLVFILTFAAGAAVGLGSFVKVLQWLLHHRRQVFLAVVTGLMIGSLRSLWPWQDGTTLLAPPSASAVGVSALLALAGGAVVWLALAWERRHGSPAVVHA
ncbi:DUF368 domain-containing protein [Serinibacter arcticus]|uniref:DUF368 domain-containing protein n=1 Tax=Serinibacter arcticus TaxID=1655435 RepID=UPI001304F2E5|nr:DUF368 domain-containing protein [Serinibacter arcticus]